jgi:hypothetical protein
MLGDWRYDFVEDASNVYAFMSEDLGIEPALFHPPVSGPPIDAVQAARDTFESACAQMADGDTFLVSMHMHGEDGSNPLHGRGLKLQQVPTVGDGNVATGAYAQWDPVSLPWEQCAASSIVIEIDACFSGMVANAFRQDIQANPERWQGKWLAIVASSAEDEVSFGGAKGEDPGGPFTNNFLHELSQQPNFRTDPFGAVIASFDEAAAATTEATGTKATGEREDGSPILGQHPVIASYCAPDLSPRTITTELGGPRFRIEINPSGAFGLPNIISAQISGEQGGLVIDLATGATLFDLGSEEIFEAEYVAGNGTEGLVAIRSNDVSAYEFFEFPTPGLDFPKTLENNAYLDGYVFQGVNDEWYITDGDQVVKYTWGSFNRSVVQPASAKPVDAGVLNGITVADNGKVLATGNPGSTETGFLLQAGSWIEVGDTGTGINPVSVVTAGNLAIVSNHDSGLNASISIAIRNSQGNYEGFDVPQLGKVLPRVVSLAESPVFIDAKVDQDGNHLIGTTGLFDNSFSIVKLGPAGEFIASDTFPLDPSGTSPTDFKWIPGTDKAVVLFRDDAPGGAHYQIIETPAAFK